MRVPARVCNKALLGRDCTVNVLGWNTILFREAVGNHSRNILMKKVKHVIIHAPYADAKLVDAITQLICHRAAKLMAEIPKPHPLRRYRDARLPRSATGDRHAQTADQMDQMGPPTNLGGDSLNDFAIWYV